MNIICLDTEFTGTIGRNEILELSIFNRNGEEIYHQMFKPDKCKRWPFTEKIHGITPQMVADKPSFRDKLPEMQKIFDEADVIVGFAIENDIKHLEQSGIKGLYEERCLDVRHLYWSTRGEAEGITLFSVPNLVKCATDCGYDWENAKAHSASDDAMATLHCYRVLMKEFIKAHNIAADDNSIRNEHVLDGITMLKEIVDKAVYDHERESAHGYIYLFKRDEMYFLVVRHTEMEQEYIAKKAAKSVWLVAAIQVEDRWHAQYDIQKKFQRKWVKGNKGVPCWRLTDRDISYFKKYSNEYRGDSKLYKHILENGNIK